ncbi:uncharacterized protein [Procambarus clarkii]|uniref:uncharacterized protein n=1 Tax=Procambarus clarkii TaxID=6728 RepID=UPI003743267A
MGPKKAHGVGDQAPKSDRVGRPGSVAPAALGPDLAPPLTLLTTPLGSPPSVDGLSHKPPLVTTSLYPGTAQSLIVTTAAFNRSLGVLSAIHATAALLEVAILNLKHRERLSFPEASRQVRRLPPYVNVSYARVLRSSSPCPSHLPPSHNRFRALDPDTLTAISSVPLSSVPKGPPHGSQSGVPLLSAQSVMSPVSSSSSPFDPPHPSPLSLGSPRQLSVWADVHRSPSCHRVVCPHSASPVEMLDSIVQYIVAGTPVSLSQKQKLGSSPSSSLVSKKASLSSSSPTSDSLAPSSPVSMAAPPAPAMEVSLAPTSLSVAALAEVCFSLSAPPPPPAVLDCPSQLSPPPPEPARPLLVCSPAPFPPSLLSLPMPPNPDWADPDLDPELL